MNYGIAFGTHALESVFNLNLPEIVDCVEAALNRLTEDPVNLSERSVFPYPFGQVFEFQCAADDGSPVHLAAHFYYGDDEFTLRVFDVIATTLG